MRKKYFFAGLMAATLMGAVQAHAAFPTTTGSCQGQICFFNNDLIKTRTVGATAEQFVVETLNANVRNRFGDRERELEQVGDAFAQRYSANTLNHIYTSNDVFVTDPKAYQRALHDYQRAVATNNQSKMRAAERQAKRATATGGTIISVIGYNQPIKFPTQAQLVPGTESHPVFVGNNPGNVFAPGVRELGSLRTDRKFNAKHYDMLSKRYDRISEIKTGWEKLLEKRLAQRDALVKKGRSTRSMDREIERVQSRINRWEQRGLETAERAVGLIGGKLSTSIADAALLKLLGQPYDPKTLSTLVGLDLFSKERWGQGAFEQFFPIDKLEDGGSLAFSYISLIKDSKGKTFIGFGVVSQHNRFVAGNV